MQSTGTREGACHGDLGVGRVVGGRMAAALRLIACLLFALVGLWASPAHATLPPGDVNPVQQTQYCVSWPGGNPNGTCFSDGGSACQTAGPYYWDPRYNSFSYHADNNMCYVNETYTFTGVSIKMGLLCNSDAHDDPDSPGACKCNTGFSDPVIGKCRESQDSDCPGAGTDIGGADNVLPRQAGGGSCVGGCLIRGSGAVTGANGESVSYGPYTSTGKACKSTDNQTPLPGGSSTAGCVKGGGLPGTVNGVAVCTPGTSTTSSSTSATASTSASGASSGSTTTTDVTDNHDGTSTTTTTTTNSDGSTTVTHTTAPTPSAAASGSGGSSPNESGDFCKLHPDLPVCKQSTWTGTCQSQFTCTGDAVQCAIAQEQHTRDCDFYDPSGQPGAVGDAANRFTQALADGDHPAWSPTAGGGGSSDAALDMSSSIRTDKHWGSECVADQALALSSYSVTIPWSGLCGQMTMIGNVVLAVTTLICVGIVFKN